MTGNPCELPTNVITPTNMTLKVIVVRLRSVNVKCGLIGGIRADYSFY